MKYFVKNQYNNIVIANLKKEPSEKIAKYYTAVTEEQEAFIAEHPKATVMEIYNMQMNEDVSTYNKNSETFEISLDEYKAIAKEGISELSLMTSRRFVSDYQFLNSQASLLVEDGNGIYSHEDATNYIKEYNKVGAKCRSKYYEFLNDLNTVSTLDEAKSLVDNITKWYDEL